MNSDNVSLDTFQSINLSRRGEFGTLEMTEESESKKHCHPESYYKKFVLIEKDEPVI